MHGDPHLQLEAETSCSTGTRFGSRRGDAALAAADAEAGAQGGELGQVVVGAEGEKLAAERQLPLCQAR